MFLRQYRLAKKLSYTSSATKIAIEILYHNVDDDYHYEKIDNVTDRSGQCHEM
jgi:hypothetical protein